MWLILWQKLGSNLYTPWFHVKLGKNCWNFIEMQTPDFLLFFIFFFLYFTFYIHNSHIANMNIHMHRIYNRLITKFVYAFPSLFCLSVCCLSLRFIFNCWKYRFQLINRKIYNNYTICFVTFRLLPFFIYFVVACFFVFLCCCFCCCIQLLMFCCFSVTYFVFRSCIRLYLKLQIIKLF